MPLALHCRYTLASRQPRGRFIRAGKTGKPRERSRLLARKML